MTGTKTITFVIPCYNSADYMDACIESILPCGEDIEILIINDGSTKDNTLEKAKAWEERYPGICRAIDKENGGHGSGVNRGLAEARGRYFKVVDSDDWLGEDAMHKIMAYLRPQCELQYPTDMVVANYVYEKVYDNTRTVMRYKNVFPVGRKFTWSDIKHFKPSQVLLMHSVIYRTELLREIGLQLPEHCFYVDNIFVYVPLPAVKTIYYLDLEMYHYFIGREDQSVNESIMMGRIDQQLKITRVMIDAVKFPDDVPDKKLQKYMENYLSMMMCICSIFLRMIGTSEAEEKRHAIWDYLADKDYDLYKRVRRNVVNFWTNIPTPIGKNIGIAGYHIAQKIFKFN